MAVLNPLVTKLSRHKIPRTLSIIVTYLLVLTIISVTVASVVPPLIDQTSGFLATLPTYVNNVGISTAFGDQLLEQLASQLGSLPAQLGRFTISVFSNVIGIVTVFVFAFYLLSGRDRLDDQLAVFFGDDQKAVVARFVDTLESKLGGWARAQLSLMLVIGVSSYIGLSLLGIPYALPLSILAGLLEVVPYAGPIIAAIPAVVIGFGISPVMGFATASLAFLIQQLENYVFVPKIMQHSAGVSPLVTLVALSIGFRLAGVVGLLMSVPVYLTLHLIVKTFFVHKTASLKI